MERAAHKYFPLLQPNNFFLFTVSLSFFLSFLFFVFLSLARSLSLSIYLSIYLTISLSIYLPLCLLCSLNLLSHSLIFFICLHFSPFVYFSLSVSLYPSIYIMSFVFQSISSFSFCVYLPPLPFPLDARAIKLLFLKRIFDIFLFERTAPSSWIILSRNKFIQQHSLFNTYLCSTIKL